MCRLAAPRNRAWGASTRSSALRAIWNRRLSASRIRDRESAMLFGETLRVALQSIRANLFRAALTMLGIVIGVAAVITMLAAGSGAQRAVEEQIEALGANVLSISAQSWFLRGVSRQQLTLEVEDVWALEEKSKYIDLVV
ncbi:MAG TPA: hypothetical protein EYM63_11265, partial [Acidobacteria bacterium]|nr:hypothetical protein [Acidobacteriota bacterium]